MVEPAHAETGCDGVRKAALESTSGTDSERSPEQPPTGVSDPALASEVDRWKLLSERGRQAIVTLVNAASVVDR